MTADESLIPTHRLGQALGWTRRAADRSLEELAADSAGRWTSLRLRAAESGVHAVTDAEARELVALYGLDPRGMGDDSALPGRQHVELDRLGTSTVLAGDVLRIGPELELDPVLERLLAIVSVARRSPTPATTLRRHDLDIVALAMEAEPRQVESRLAVVAAAPKTRATAARLANRLMIPAIGAHVATGPGGTLVLRPAS